MSPSMGLGPGNSSRDSSLIALQTKQTELEKYTALNDLTSDYKILQSKLNETLGLLARKDIDIKEGLKTKTYEISVVNQKHDELVKKSLLTSSREKPRLYEIPYDTSDPANRFCPDGEETVTLEKESRSKLDKDKVKPYNYTYQNSLYETFKPPSKAYLDQLERAKEIRKTMWRKTFVRTKPNIAKNVGFLPMSKSISKSRLLYNEMTNNFNHFRTICQQTWSNHTSSAFPNPTAKSMEVLIKILLMPLSDKTILDSHCFIHELKREMNDDLEYVNSLEKELDELESEKADFSNIYDLLLEECVSKDGNPHMDLQDKGVIDSGCSRYMTGNVSYLTDFEEIDGGYVAFGVNSKGGKITGKGTKACDDAGDDEKKVGEDLRIDSEGIDQEKEENVNSTNTVNAASTNEVNAVGVKTSIELLDDPNMPELYDIVDSNNDEDVSAEADMNNLDAFIPVSPFPTTRVHKDHPVEKIIRDLNSAPQTRRMIKNLKEHEPKKLQEVWTLVDLPNGKRAIGTKWVFRNKKDERGIVIKNKTRLVSQGYTQEEGIDYDEVFAPVARIEAIRLFLAYALFKDFMVYQMDVKSAFLYSKIEEKVYVCQPPGFEDPDFPDRVYKVENALYGLHQAPRAWYETLSTYLFNNRFQRGTIDKTLFIKRDKGDILLVQVYVDDIIFCSKKKSLCTEFEKMMHKKFQISFMGEITFFLGLQVKHKQDGIFINQEKYVTEILKKFGFTDVKPARTPMETKKPLLKDEDGEEVDVHLYRLMIVYNCSNSGVTYEEEAKRRNSEAKMKTFKGNCHLLLYAVSNKEDTANSGMTYEEEAKRRNSEAKIKTFEGNCHLLLYAVSNKEDMEYPLLTYTPYAPTGHQSKVTLALSVRHSTYCKDTSSPACACTRYQVNPKVSHLHAMKRIFRYLKGQPKLGLWYPKDSPFYLVAYTDSDYAGASSDRKSTTGGCQFLGYRLISWQCKKQTVVANSITEAKYVAALSCCDQHIEIRHHFIRDSNEKKLIRMIKIHADKNVAVLLTKAFDNGMEKLLRMKLELVLATAKAKTVNGEVHLQTLVDGKKVIITETSVRRDLQLEYVNGNDCLPNATIFEQLTLMGVPSDPIAAEAINKENVPTHSNDPLLSGDFKFLGDQEDASKQVRKIDIIDADVEITLVDETQGRHDDDMMFDTGVLNDEEVFAGQDMAKKEVSTADLVTTAGEAVTTANVEVSTASPTAATITTVELTLAQTLAELKSARPRTKGVVMQELSESVTTTTTTIPSKDKGKGIMVKDPLKMKNKDKEKKQKIDDDQEEAEMKKLIKVVPDEEEVAIDAIPLATKPPSIMLRDFDREDLETLWKLVKAKHGSTRPEEGYERVLWGDLRIMFEHNIEDTVWRNLLGNKVLI
ncbi:putative ribonuclease H-like domain-containing protein [Tanacetum coccineum]|uniref:Ribonuclease H-like domain-containing protein n=1 Tax=Tanacetum coccineum TaxID=301880 RepID=A0ABQ4Y0E3_9ASTR